MSHDYVWHPWKIKTNGDQKKKKISGFQQLKDREKWIDGEDGIFSNGSTMCDTMMVDIYHYTCI